VNTHRVDESDRLRERVAGVVESYGLELFDLQFRRESYGWILRVVIDRPWDGLAARVDATPGTPPIDEPVGIDDCGRVSQDLSAILDVESELVGGIDRTYTLGARRTAFDRADSRTWCSAGAIAGNRLWEPPSLHLPGACGARPTACIVPGDARRQAG